MPTLTRTISQLAPNTSDPNNPNSQSSWFSYVRTVYSRQRGGTVIPPTKTEFMREWNSCCRSNFNFRSHGETLEEHKAFLESNRFPPLLISSITSGQDLTKELKIATWTRMIMAFNMYADVRRLFHERKSNKVDFISSMGNDYSVNRWESYFQGRCVLFIRDEEIRHMSELIKHYVNIDFWRHIFHIYESQPQCFRININNNIVHEYLR